MTTKTQMTQHYLQQAAVLAALQAASNDGVRYLAARTVADSSVPVQLVASDSIRHLRWMADQWAIDNAAGYGAIFDVPLRSVVYPLNT